MITFSKSKLNTYLACPEKYRLGYELGIRSPRSSPTLVEGSAIHHLVQSGLVNGMIEDVLLHASITFWNEHPFENCGYETEEEYFAAQAKCLNQSESFLEQLGPLQVRHVEHRCGSPLIHPITLAAHPGIALTGFIDLVITDHQGQSWVLDLKTVARSPREGMARVALELSLYAYLFSLPFTPGEFMSMPVALVYLIRTKAPQVHWDESRRAMPHFVELYRICRKVARDIEQGHFWRNPGIHCGWCDYQAFCYAEHENAISLFGGDNWQRYLQDQAEREQIPIPANL